MTARFNTAGPPGRESPVLGAVSSYTKEDVEALRTLARHSPDCICAKCEDGFAVIHRMEKALGFTTDPALDAAEQIGGRW